MLPNDKRFLKGVRLILVGIILILMAWQILGCGGGDGNTDDISLDSSDSDLDIGNSFVHGFYINILFGNNIPFVDERFPNQQDMEIIDHTIECLLSKGLIQTQHLEILYNNIAMIIEHNGIDLEWCDPQDDCVPIAPPGFIARCAYDIPNNITYISTERNCLAHEIHHWIEWLIYEQHSHNQPFFNGTIGVCQ
jgi:hypothetical protein